MNSVNEKIFRAYDIRGIYPQDLNEKTAYQIGRAFAAYLKESETESPEKIAVGRDARVSSPILSRSFIAGVTDEGINVLDIGQITVDMAYFASGYFHIPAAMITASHNPKKYNGFKLMKKNVEFIGSGSGLEEIKKMITGENILPRFKVERGKVTEQSVLNNYLNHVLNFVDIDALRLMRVAIDTGLGR